jgi:hypothetical protein
VRVALFGAAPAVPSGDDVIEGDVLPGETTPSPVGEPFLYGRLTIGHAPTGGRRGSTAHVDRDFGTRRVEVETADGPRAVEILTKRQEDIGFTQILFDDHIGKVSLVGAGMRSHPGVTATFCEALAKADINIDLISTSEIRISVLVKDTELDDAVRVIHDAFGLGGEEEAVVHAGTGR